MQVAIVNKFKKFRDQIFNCFSFRADFTVVQLCLNPIFRRRYESIRDAISHFATDPQQNMRLENCL